MGQNISNMGVQVGHLFDPAVLDIGVVEHSMGPIGHLFDHTVSETRIGDDKIVLAFNKATNGAHKLTFRHVQELFPDDLAMCMWPFLSPTNESLTIEEFAESVRPLLEFPVGVYIGILRPAETFVTVCARAAGVQMQPDDGVFVRKLKENMTELGDTPEALVRWKTGMCCYVGRALNALICHKFLGTNMPKYHLTSRILCQSQMWFLQSCLPYNYFPKPMGRRNQWTLLHDSGKQGANVQSFIQNVFGYHGHTMMVIKLKGGRTVALATETDWRDDTLVHGGAETVFVELEPEIKRVQVDSFHCNFKSHYKERGLVIRDVLHIDGDLSEVDEMEVWGCSGVPQHAQDVWSN